MLLELVKRIVFRGDCYQHGRDNQLNLSSSRMVAIVRVVKKILGLALTTFLGLGKD